MPPELTEVREWVRKAGQDRRMAEAGLAQQPPITDAAAFHCQQAVEKLLKAFLVHRRQPFERVHDLGALIDSCASLDPAWNALRDAVEPLTAYAVRFRYPGPADPTVDEVRAALVVVQRVAQFLEARLPATDVQSD
jgi:HEPN domain-containing protein